MAVVLGWGLWNPHLTEWFNPGGRRPFFKTREEAERMRRAATRQYPIGTWEPREYVVAEDDEPPAGEEQDATDQRDGARPGTGSPAAPRPDA